MWRLLIVKLEGKQRRDAPLPEPGDAAESARPPQKITIFADSIDTTVLPIQRGNRQPSPVVSSVFSDMKWAAQASTRALHPREIDGIKAVGTLRSYAISAGELGNRNPIVVSDETWYAPDLHITLSTRHSDPRTGDSLFASKT